MKHILFRLLALLLCFVAMNCGSSPTGPGEPGGGGGTGGGGGGGTGQTHVASDGLFDDNNWDLYLEASGAGGTGDAGHLSYLGQVGGDYRRVTVTVASAQGSSTAAQVAVFSIKRDRSYSPLNDGPIYSIDYSEDSILLSGGGNGQYSAPALRQNGKLYTLVPGGGAFTTPEATWTPHSRTGLRRDDFRTLASASDHPDFSATGSLIELGFMRLHSVPAGGAGETKAGGIDNWRITLYR